jgi:hypothetical protein
MGFDKLSPNGVKLYRAGSIVCIMPRYASSSNCPAIARFSSGNSSKAM